MLKSDFDLKKIVILNNLRAFIRECEKAKVTDEQWFIDFECELSQLATLDHNKQINEKDF